METRLSPALNLLTADNLYACKNKKSTIDILSTVNNQIREGATTQVVLPDFSKAFGNIERDILWAKLYAAGIRGGNSHNFLEWDTMDQINTKMRRVHRTGNKKQRGTPRNPSKCKPVRNICRTNDGAI